MYNYFRSLLLAVVLLNSPAEAAQRIAVLAFELNDITSLPNTLAEQQRTATMAPILIETLARSGDYQLQAVDADLQKSANGGFGYLFQNPEYAADLGRELGADLIIVSQHSKPSFLFSYLWVYLVDVKTETTLARYDIELKGNHEKVTRYAMASLAKKIEATLQRR